MEKLKSDFVNYREADIRLTLEIPLKYWDNHFLNYSVKDFCPGGEIVENIESMPIPEKVKQGIRSGFYFVIPKNPEWFMDDAKTLTNYLYMGDHNGKLSRFYFKESKDLEPSSPEKSSGRFLTS